MLELANSFELKIADIWFKREEEKNVKAIPGEEVMMQQRLIVMNIFRKAVSKK